MIDYLKRVISLAGYRPSVDFELIHTNEQQSEYFFIEEYSEDEFANFFEVDKTGKIIEDFLKAQKNSGLKHVKKNTSLLLLIKVDNIEQGYEDYKNQILYVEEDSYYFRKFVILYSDKALENITHQVTLQELYEKLKAGISDFEKNMFFDESYFLAMEIAIKLPFFVIPQAEENYKTIEERFRDSEKDNLDQNLIEAFWEEENIVELLTDISEDNKDRDSMLLLIDNMFE
ncbi:ABC-three component system middle component 1 [Lactococcus lactis]|uniref:Uncharacterized protein n=1 Tax=Lactococcus lactis TaxID=1358 RepID=A0AAW8UJ01_9LACT|nr:ABC-three component system middle component 1 [Lactococcus lactis]MCT3092474.1 hypothetical protein [Lactococcus lactis]MDT2881651.1 hypothetical protein [Lactococcus lactis]MDT2946316.1 hypothetical protein [Lactococcus lactis]